MKMFLHLLVSAFFITSCSQPQNLLTNPGFETGSGEAPEGWSGMVTRNVQSHILGTDTSVSHSGKASFKIARVWCYPWQQTGLKSASPVKIDPAKKYILCFWYKTKGIDEYPLALVSQFKVKCDTAPTVTYKKSISNSDSWQQHFILLDNIPADAKELDLSFYCWIRTKGSIWLDDIEFREASKTDVAAFEKWRRRPEPSPVGKSEKGKFAATGFFRVEKDSTRWWYVDPDGNPEWAIASVGDMPNLNDPAAKSDWFRTTYGSTHEEVARSTYGILNNDCGFNWFAGWTGQGLASVTDERCNSGKTYMPLTQVMNLSDAGDMKEAYARDKNGNLLNKSGHWVVDPFNPEWRKLATAKAEKMIAANKGKKWFAGWYIDNEMDYDDLFRFIWADYSSKEFIKMLKEEYGTVENLNKAWSSRFATYNYVKFDSIIADKPEPKDWDDPSWPDFMAFERRMMGEYIDFTYNLVKGLDPDHIVISNRLHLGAMPHLYRTIDLWGKYDLICMNIYPDNNMIGFNPGELEIMKKLHEGTKRPVIIGEWSVPAIDSKLYQFGRDSLGRPLDWSWPQVTRTQKERGESYRMCVKQLASLDFMIGSGWFKTTDVNAKERRANRGLMNGSFELYRDLTDEMKRTNDELKKEMELPW
ncbi:MAG TPA: beta-galactosidase [Bacteroidales bacterium]|jgi:hypothetical protein|nr:beta-galactosidase [Bacteroidales bacterium]